MSGGTSRLAFGRATGKGGAGGEINIPDLKIFSL